MPVNYPASYVGAEPQSQGDTLVEAGINMGLDAGEFATVFVQGFSNSPRPAAEVAETFSFARLPLATILSGMDVMYTGIACFGLNECYIQQQPHTSLPEMTVISQDVLVTGADFAIPLLVSARFGPAAGGVADLSTSGASFFYDLLDAAGQIPNYVSLGYDGQSYYILYYPPDQTRLSSQQETNQIGPY